MIEVKRLVNAKALSGEEIHLFRVAAHYRQKELARLVGIRPEHFSRIENGHTQMSTITEKLMRTFFADRLNPALVQKILFLYLDSKNGHRPQ